MRGFLIIFLSLTFVSYAFTPKGFPFSSAKPSDIPQEESVSYQTYYYDQKVSHYNYKFSGQTFKQKYLLDTTNWDQGEGPILFYCGNEGPI